ncbi:MAG: hypothetical protein KC609_22775 [Myxococcales bacterium]|nr:hypothetical protein [Myxococcales bacterium]
MPSRLLIHALLLLFTATLVLACAGEPTPAPNTQRVDDSLGGKSDSPSFSATEKSRVLELVNQTTLDELDNVVGLDRRAAENIIAHRAGADGLLGTSDDLWFTSWDELDAIAYVGPAALTKLVSYVSAKAPVDLEQPCLIISEYIEGQGNNNKALELYNCGERPLLLHGFGVCVLRSATDLCSDSQALGGGMLQPGAVLTLCRTRGGTFQDPFVPLRDRCQVEMKSVLNVNGDDRLVILFDRNGDGAFDLAHDQVVDMLGRFGWYPSTFPFADVALRRCNLTPFLGDRYFSLEEHYTVHPRHDFTDYGVPPTPGCPE